LINASACENSRRRRRDFGKAQQLSGVVGPEARVSFPHRAIHFISLFVLRPAQQERQITSRVRQELPVASREREQFVVAPLRDDVVARLPLRLVSEHERLLDLSLVDQAADRIAARVLERPVGRRGATACEESPPERPAFGRIEYRLSHPCSLLVLCSEYSNVIQCGRESPLAFPPEAAATARAAKSREVSGGKGRKC
jgi:hypothetical protein